MSLAEKDIADNIASAIAALGIVDAQIVSPWAVVANGVRNAETSDAAMVVEVGVGNRMYDTPQQCMARWSCSIELAVREECDPTGARGIDAWTAIMDMLQDWQDSLEAAETALTASSLDITGFKVDGSESPVRDDDGCWRVRQGFTVMGTVNQTTPPNNQTTQGD